MSCLLGRNFSLFFEKWAWITYKCLRVGLLCNTLRFHHFYTFIVLFIGPILRMIGAFIVASMMKELFFISLYSVKYFYTTVTRLYWHYLNDFWSGSLINFIRSNLTTQKNTYDRLIFFISLKLRNSYIICWRKCNL